MIPEIKNQRPATQNCQHHSNYMCAPGSRLCGQCHGQNPNMHLRKYFPHSFVLGMLHLQTIFCVMLLDCHQRRRTFNYQSRLQQTKIDSIGRNLKQISILIYDFSLVVKIVNLENIEKRTFNCMRTNAKNDKLDQKYSI